MAIIKRLLRKEDRGVNHLFITNQRAKPCDQSCLFSKMSPVEHGYGVVSFFVRGHVQMIGMPGVFTTELFLVSTC
jgi:hypothetical protein